MRALALALFVLFGVISPAPRAQVTAVPNSGCPQSTAPQSSTAARIGQRFSFTWSCSLPTRQGIAMLGVASGGGFSFGPPLTCDAGPCGWYPGPIGGGYHAWPMIWGGGTWDLDIPNDPQLVGTAWGVQCVCWCA